MVKTKREFIFGTCFLSGAAAILSFVSLGTQEWVTSSAIVPNTNSTDGIDSVNFGLFRGQFNQKTGNTATYELSIACAFDLNVCAMLCGDNAEDFLRELYNSDGIPENSKEQCLIKLPSKRVVTSMRGSTTKREDRTYINAGVFICTILFLILSAVMGVFSSALSIWNTASNPYQAYFSIFGLYIYNGIAAVCVLLALVLWGAMFAQDMTGDLPTFKLYVENFTTEDLASLGYSYWLNLVSFVFYLISIGLLYARNYFISKEPEVNVHLEDKADPVIYLY